LGYGASFGLTGTQGGFYDACSASFRLASAVGNFATTTALLGGVGKIVKMARAAWAARAAAANGRFYSVAFETRLNPASYPGVRRAIHFQEANEALLTAMESDAQMAQAMRQGGVSLERTATGLAPRQPPAGWTWHHAQEPGVMQLVPRAQHGPGSIFQDVLHPGGSGGYARWGN